MGNKTLVRLVELRKCGLWICGAYGANGMRGLQIALEICCGCH